MPKLPILSGKEWIKFLEWLGFVVVRVNGSHHRMKSEDGRVTTIPVHGNEDLPVGLMRKIIREDLELRRIYRIIFQVQKLTALEFHFEVLIWLTKK
jgi:predicted RNA binding protein YcfA (HicA-like mRNA interferase family)